MKRLSLVIGLILAFVAPITMSSPASAETPPTDGNVWLSYSDYNGGSIEAWHHDPTPENPYNSSMCEPQECSTIVVSTRKGKSTIALKRISSETLVYGARYYSNADYSVTQSQSWDGSSAPMTIKVKTKKGKPVTLKLRSAYLSLHNPGFPVPDYGGYGSMK